MTTRDKSVVQAVELWLPQGEVLAFGAGAYRGNQDLAAHSARLNFRYGEGLPGAVWASGKALLWKELDRTFVRAEIASEVGIDAALGCPLFDGNRLVAVLTLLLSHRAEVPGCVEIWDVTDELDVLRHAGGYYTHAAELERFSPHIQFQRGTGLPGLTWLSGTVQVMQDVRQSNAFIRAGLAARCGLKNGLGIPIYRDRHVVQVLALLGAEQFSFMRGVEIYRPERGVLGAATLVDWSGRGSARGESSADAPGRKLAEQVMASCLPALAETRSPSGAEISLALSLSDRKGHKEIVVLRF